MTNTFEIGKKYIHGVNPHCQFVEVIDRTAKTVTVRYGCAYEGGSTTSMMNRRGRL